MPAKITPNGGGGLVSTAADYVKFMQMKLGVSPTGVYDETTKAAVVAAQKANKALGTPDGIVGPATWKHITK